MSAPQPLNSVSYTHLDVYKRQAESSETPGLGTQIAESDFKNQFTGKNVSSFTAVKGKTSADSDIAVISGATISSKAVVEGMNLALAAYPNVKEAASR